jgi:hypothetical protein
MIAERLATTFVGLGARDTSLAPPTVTEVLNPDDWNPTQGLPLRVAVSAAEPTIAGRILDASAFSAGKAQIVSLAAAGAGGTVVIQSSNDQVNWEAESTSAINSVTATYVDLTTFGRYLRVAIAFGGAGPDELSVYVLIHCR